MLQVSMISFDFYAYECESVLLTQVRSYSGASNFSRVQMSLSLGWVHLTSEDLICLKAVTC